MFVRLGAPLFIRGYMRAKTDRSLRAPSPPRENARRRSDHDGALAKLATPEHDLGSRAAGLVARTLIVWGNEDIAIPQRAGRATHAAIRGSLLEILDTGHVVFSSDPDGFLAVAEPFIAAVSARTESVAVPSRHANG